jgi:predicted transcriptional regulator
LAKESRVYLIKKYDISQKILNELVHLESRHILFSMMKRRKSIQDICREQKIPQSSVYKRIQLLKECSLIHENADFSESGHVTKYYQSKIKDIEISMTKFEPKISFRKNKLIKND